MEDCSDTCLSFRPCGWPSATTLAPAAPHPILWIMSLIAEPDHERAAREHQVAMIRAMSPQQRLQQALRMNRSMRALMAAGYRDRHPTWTENDVRRAVAERILHARTG
jgi:hypothetical protein